LEELEKLLCVVPSYGNLELSSWLKRWQLLQSDEANKWRSFLRKNINGFQLKPFELSGSLPNETLLSRLRSLQSKLKEAQENNTENGFDLELDLNGLKTLLENETEDSQSYINPEGIPTNTPQLLLAALRELFMERLLTGTLREDFDEQVNPLYTDQMLTLNSNLCHCLKTLQSASHSDVTSAWIELKKELNELQDQKALNLSALLIARLVVDDIPSDAVTTVQHMNALQYSEALLKHEVTEKYSNDFLANLSSFLEALHISLLEDLEAADLDLPQYAQLVTRFYWFNRIVATAQQKLLYSNELHVPLMHKLVLHFQWLEKHLLRPLFEMNGNISSDRKLTIQESVLKIKGYIEETRRPLNVSCKIYSKQFTQFQPYYQDQQVSNLFI